MKARRANRTPIVQISEGHNRSLTELLFLNNSPWFADYTCVARVPCVRQTGVGRRKTKGANSVRSAHTPTRPFLEEPNHARSNDESSE